MSQRLHTSSFRAECVKVPFPKESFTLFQVMSQYLLHSEHKYFLDNLNKQNLDRTAAEAIGMFLFDSLRPINNLTVMQGRVFLG